MSKIVVIAGKSASGKSTAYCKLDYPDDNIKIEGLKPEETFLINTVNKELPVPPGTFTEFRMIEKDGKKGVVGNKITGWNYNKISSSLQLINKNPKIKNIIVEDAQYLLSMDFFDRRVQTGFEKYAQMGFSFVNLIMHDLRELREDIIVFIIMHTDEYKEDKEIFIKLKTIGKMLDEKFTIEGLFSTVLVAQRRLKGRNMVYSFRTLPQHENDIAKSVLGVFVNEQGRLVKEIPNDLGIVRNAFNLYYKFKIN